MWLTLVGKEGEGPEWPAAGTRRGGCWTGQGRSPSPPCCPQSRGGPRAATWVLSPPTVTRPVARLGGVSPGPGGLGVRGGPAPGAARSGWALPPRGVPLLYPSPFPAPAPHWLRAPLCEGRSNVPEGSPWGARSRRRAGVRVRVRGPRPARRDRLLQVLASGRCWALLLGSGPLPCSGSVVETSRFGVVGSVSLFCCGLRVSSQGRPAPQDCSYSSHVTESHPHLTARPAKLRVPGGAPTTSAFRSAPRPG